MNAFSYLVPHDAIGRTGPLTLDADASACAGIAARLGLESVARFTVEAILEPVTGGALLRGKFTAKLVQACAATGLPLAETVTAPFALHFVAAFDLPNEAEAEVELGNDDLDTMVFEAGGVDVAEAAVQTLALVLDPFPRHPDADRILKERGVLSEDQAGPFAALAALKRG